MAQQPIEPAVPGGKAGPAAAQQPAAPNGKTLPDVPHAPVTPDAPDQPDEALVARVCARDALALAALYDRYAPAVYATARRALGPADAEEVVQEAFLRLWRSAHTYDPARSPFGAWFMAIARHRTLTALAQRGRLPDPGAAEAAERALAAAPDLSVDVEGDAALREDAAAVRRALVDLPEDQRRVLVMAYFGGFSQSAMAERLGWPLGTVKKRVRLGMQKLRAALSGPTAHTDAVTPGNALGKTPALLNGARR